MKSNEETIVIGLKVLVLWAKIVAALEMGRPGHI